MYNHGQHPQYKNRVCIFTGCHAFGTQNPQPWYKPKDARFIKLQLHGAGGGGAAGTSGTAGTSRNGGGGGGSGGYVSVLFDARVLPDVLYLWLSTGGQGGQTSGQSGGGGGAAAAGSQLASVITASPYTAASGAASIIAVNDGAGGTSAAAGAAGTVIASSTLYWGSYALSYNALGGTPGSAPGTGAGTDLTQSNVYGCGGTAGGGVATSTPSRGGNITLGHALEIVGFDTGSRLINAGGASGGTAGQQGLDNLLGAFPYIPSTGPFLTGGSGGGSINSGTGGAGGKGGLGSGGGGGAAGTTQGVGGNGGPAFCIVEWW